MTDTYQSKYTGAQIDERLELAEEISPHIAKQLNTETGIHGIRFWQNKLEYNDGEVWVEIETGGGGGSFVVKGLYANLSALMAAHPTGEAGDAYAVGSAEDNNVYIWSIVSSAWVNIGPLRGEKGDTGADGVDGRGIVSVTRTSGTGAPGTTDTYTITYTDNTTSTFQVYNGADGEGAGDMLKSIYDPNNKNADAFSMDNMVEGTTNKVFTATEKTKLAGIDENANNYIHPGSGTNPHGTTKADVGLGNVDDVKQMPIAGGTFTGVAVAQTNTSYTTRQLRNAILSTSDPSGGSNGDIWIKYT
jgi:hypothetical protein